MVQLKVRGVSPRTCRLGWVKHPVMDKDGEDVQVRMDHANGKASRRCLSMLFSFGPHRAFCGSHSQTSERDNPTDGYTRFAPCKE